MSMQDKNKFRTHKIWKDFRKSVKKERKVDAITGKPLTKTWNCHHCDFDEKNYENLNPENFEALNNLSHDVVHFFFGVPGKLKPWRRLVLKLIKILKKMERINGKNL